MGKRGTTLKEWKWKMKENYCGYHSKVCTQVVSTTCLFKFLSVTTFIQCCWRKVLPRRESKGLNERLIKSLLILFKIRGWIFLKREGMIRFRFNLGFLIVSIWLCVWDWLLIQFSIWFSLGFFIMGFYLGMYSVILRFLWMMGSTQFFW